MTYFRIHKNTVMTHGSTGAWVRHPCGSITEISRGILSTHLLDLHLADLVFKFRKPELADWHRTDFVLL